MRAITRARTAAVLLVASSLVGAVGLSACGDDDAAGDRAADDQPADDQAADDEAAAAPEWPAPDDPAERAEEAGLQLELSEHLATHRHAHLDVFVDGQPVTVPAGI